ncbi:MAG: hypothetical protein ACP5MD_11310, partial [Verrucomicrobiia bacterium]
MKPDYFLALALLGSPLFQGLAQTSPPRLLGLTTPAAQAVPVPETTVLNALSDDGRWLLLTSASDRLMTNDWNAASDVFLFDRVSGKTTLISASNDAAPGNGTSLGFGMSSDTARVVLLSRATNLANQDTNGTWDVFVREVPAASTLLVSLASDGGNSVGPAFEPTLSLDGRYVIFRSPARDLAPGAYFFGDNLYLRDLEECRTECLTTNLPVTFEATWRMTAWAATPDARVLVVTAKTLTAVASTNMVAWRNLVTGESIDCSLALPPEIPRANTTSFSAPSVSADGQFVAFRFDSLLSSSVMRLGLCLYDVARGAATVVSLRTNRISGLPLIPTAMWSSLSSNGQYLAYVAPLPTYDTSSGAITNGPSQVYFYDAQTRTTRLVSAAEDGITPANADAYDARITPDGRLVLFVSRATNLCPDALAEANRLYLWDPETGSLRASVELGDSNPSGQFVMSPFGAWVAALGQEKGVHAIYYLNTAEHALDWERFPLTVEQSNTGPGWIGVQPAGVSADGRYVALTAFAPGPVGRTSHMQVLLVDTQTGSRQLMTQGVDGNLAGSHPSSLPVLSPDGAKLLFASAATNLLPADINGLTDVFVQTVATGERTVLRSTQLSADANPCAVGPVSPDSRIAVVSFLEGGKTNTRLADLASGQISAAFAGVVVGPPSFNQTGQKIALSLSTNKTTGTYPKVAVYDTDAWLGSGDNPSGQLWLSSADAREPVLSADG